MFSVTNFERMVLVALNCDVFQILWVIVCMYSIKVVDLVAYWTRTNKRRCNQKVNISSCLVALLTAW